MIRALALVLMLTPVITVSTQPAADEQRRAAITLMRAINTAENAVRQRTGQYVQLAELLDHPAMGRVRPNLAIEGSVVTHQGATIRLALSTGGTQYQVAVVPGDTCGWAAFSDERGLIYTGKVLDCK